STCCRACWHGRTMVTGELEVAMAGAAMLAAGIVPRPAVFALLALRPAAGPVRHALVALPDPALELRVRRGEVAALADGFALHVASPVSRCSTGVAPECLSQ